MASPYTLGMAAAAGFGAALVLAVGGLGLSAMIAVPLGAFVFSMLGAFFLFMLASMRRMNTETIILGGIALLFLSQSLLSLIQFRNLPCKRRNACMKSVALALAAALVSSPPDGGRSYGEDAEFRQGRQHGV